MPSVSVSLHQSCPGFNGMCFISNASRQGLFWTKNLSTDLHFNNTSNLCDLWFPSPPLLMLIECQIILCECHLNTPHFLSYYRHIVLLKWPRRSALWLCHLVVIFTARSYMIINDLVFSLIDSFLAQLEHSSPLKALNQYEFSALSESGKKFSSWAFQAGNPSPLVSVSLVHSVFFLMPISSKCLSRRLC